MRLEMENNKLISIEGHIGRKAFFLNCIKAIGAFFILVISWAFITERPIYDNSFNVEYFLGLISLYTILSVCLVSNGIRRARDVFGTPVTDNPTAIISLICLGIPYINLFVFIVYSFKAGVFTEPELAAKPDIVFPVNAHFPSNNLSDEITKISALRSQGAISDEEFKIAKDKILSKNT